MEDEDCGIWHFHGQRNLFVQKRRVGFSVNIGGGGGGGGVGVGIYFVVVYSVFVYRIYRRPFLTFIVVVYIVFVYRIYRWLFLTFIVVVYIVSVYRIYRRGSGKRKPTKPTTTPTPRCILPRVFASCVGVGVGVGVPVQT